MKAADEYITLEGRSEGFYKEKGSRFIAIAMPVGSVAEAKEELEAVKKQYHDARHHCYAYRIGPDPHETRQNDDGEPSGTAGKPIFGQIQSFDATNVMIVVVRYFGGVKLGTGGLIQAYKTAARDALQNGRLISRTWNNEMVVTFDYSVMDQVMRILRDEGARIILQESREKCLIRLEIRKGNTDSMQQKINALESTELIVI